MTPDERNPEKYELELSKEKYIYNKDTGTLTTQGLCDNSYDWTQDNDIAYEGYSRLYLGLED